MTIKTDSGSIYILNATEKGLFFIKGLTEGRITSIQSIEIGKPLQLNYYAIGVYGQESSEMSLLRTSPIVSMS